MKYAVRVTAGPLRGFYLSDRGGWTSAPSTIRLFNFKGHGSVAMRAENKRRGMDFPWEEVPVGLVLPPEID